MPITPQEALQRTIEHREIFHDEMLKIVRLIMSGECSPVMMAALITGLRAGAWRMSCGICLFLVGCVRWHRCLFRALCRSTVRTGGC